VTEQETHHVIALRLHHRNRWLSVLSHLYNCSCCSFSRRRSDFWYAATSSPCLPGSKSTTSQHVFERRPTCIPRLCCKATYAWDYTVGQAWEVRLGRFAGVLTGLYMACRPTAAPHNSMRPPVPAYRQVTDAFAAFKPVQRGVTGKCGVASR